MRTFIVALSVTICAAVVGSVSDASADEDDRPTSNCRAVEKDGTPIADTNARSAMDCSRKMMDAVKREKCDENRGKRFAYTIYAPNVGGRATPQAVFCVSKR